jgi:hypothetical protein
VRPLEAPPLLLLNRPSSWHVSDVRAAGIVAGPVDLDIAPFYAVVDAAKKTAYSFFSLPVASLAPDWLEKDERRREFVSIDEAGRRLEAWVVKTKGELAEGLRIWVEWWEREGKTEYRPRKSTGEALSSSDTSLWSRRSPRSHLDAVQAVVSALPDLARSRAPVSRPVPAGSPLVRAPGRGLPPRRFQKLLAG